MRGVIFEIQPAGAAQVGGWSFIALRPSWFFENYARAMDQSRGR
jgi:hypothetical protein